VKQQGDFFEKVVMRADLPGETLPRQPLVEIARDCRVLIENHGGVTAYSPCEICVKVNFGTVCVRGHGLNLARMTKQQLVICGKIDNVSLQRRKR
jgi:sporulation protein YqfC